ncbi:MAG: glycosyltransferase family 2 protein [Caldisphaeraceae archaeon]|nr:glycosyltransferase family 2 protein [Caldisphaeraceae archaeon]MEB3797203.1 glycosyltransferase family 2 protein [Caldisphaeraceae archaeon]
MKVDLSIIVPTYNERDNLGELLRRIDGALRPSEVSYEVVIVDDNSPDGTAKYAGELSRTYPIKVLKRAGKLGLASAVLDGLKIAGGESIVIMDADLQHPPEVLSKIVEKVQDCDVVIASRYVKGGSVGEWSLLRRLISKGAILVARVLLPKVRRIKDPMSGYFAFRRDVVKGISMNPRGFKILLEVLVRGNARKVCEVPYTFSSRLKGKSKLDAGEIINYLIHLMDLAPEYIRFAVVGGIGTLVNLGMLIFLRYFDIFYALTSAVAIESSVISNFALNDIWTFKRKGKGLWRKLVKFHGSSATALLTQWAVSVTIYYMVFSAPIIAQLIGILVGFPVNYILSKRFVWSR